MNQISICTPTFNRTSLLIDSFKQVYDDERIGEIIIVDDCSDLAIYNLVGEILSHYPKVKYFRNEQNKDCYKNKCETVKKASNEYVILFDSDNELTTDYIDVIYNQTWSDDVILQPTFAKPLFDFRKYAGLYIHKNNVAEYIGKPMFDTALNACNYFINRDKYLQTFDDTIDPVTADSIYFNYCWLKNNNIIHFVKNLEYSHRVHDGSHYKNNVARTPNGFYESIINNLKQLK